MALRILLPKIGAFGLSQITTPEPLSPESKRILRHTLPSSPVAPATPKCPPPPREPYPFLWQCCSCYTTYRFSTTRRCLLCSHNYCTRELAFGSSNSSGNGNGKKRRRRSNKYCRSEFDYEGWEAWGAWRRRHVLKVESTQESDAESELEERESKFVKKTHDCFVHCDYPSQCFHTQIRVLEDQVREAAEAERVALAKLEEARWLEEDEILLEYAAATSSSSSSSEDKSSRDIKAEPEDDDDDRLELYLARDLPEDEDDKSPFFYDERMSQPSGSGNSRDITTSRPGYPVVIPGLTTSSPAVDATKLTRDELFALIDEDDDIIPFEESKAGQQQAARTRHGTSSRLQVMRHPNLHLNSNSTERVDWVREAANLERSAFMDDLADCSPYEYPSPDSSSAEWEDIEDDEDQDEEMVDNTVVAAMGPGQEDEEEEEEEEEEEGAPLRDFRGRSTCSGSRQGLDWMQANMVVCDLCF
ncbi:hypothetical protein PG996_003219 [Apiospora saccharicola]|uniref:Uncharacterized protein n=1 Tax=Apiospora saccharicola TaxID=335842 RepID=A0ABR1W0M4_9PEZI